MSGDLGANFQENDFMSGLEGISNIDRETLDQAQQFYAYFKQNDPHWSETKANNAKRCSILVASKSVILHTIDGEEIKGDMLSLSQIIRASSNFDMHSIIHQLKEFISIVKIPDNLLQDIQGLIKNFVISSLIYKKFQEKWKQLNFQGDVDHIHQIFQTSWLLIISARAYLLNRSEDIFQCGCLIIGVLNLVITNLPHSITTSMNTEILQNLCSLFQAQVDQALPWIESLNHFLADLKVKGIIKAKGDSQTRIFSENVINFNITGLGNYYQKSINLNDFDERNLAGPSTKIATPMKNRVGLTPFTRRGIIKKGITGRTLHWDENEKKIDINSNLREIPVPTSPFVIPPTPMTSAMEMNSWLSNVLDENYESQLEEICENISPSLIDEVEMRADRQSHIIEELFAERGVISINGNDRAFIAQYFESAEGLSAPVAPKRNHKVQEIRKLYEFFLFKMVKEEEENKSGPENVIAIMKNDTFHQSLYACCLESILYSYNVTSITFDEVLLYTNVLPFDFWKQINKFGTIDKTMPLQLKRHFKEIEVKILSQLAWKENSPVYKVVKQVIAKDGPADINHQSFDMFFRRFLNQAAQKVLDITSSLNIVDEIKERIWKTVKYLLSEKTEILINRHLDQLILCAVYGVCKLSACPMSFKTLVDKYTAIYNEEEGLFNFVYIDSEHKSDVIKFYNTIFLPEMKDYIKSNCSMEVPVRIEKLCPKSPLRESIPTPQFVAPTLGITTMISPIRSPYLTPRTKTLFATLESPAGDNKSVNLVIPQKSARELDFDRNGPTKKLKVFAQIFDKPESENLAMPSLKKE